MSYIGEIEPVEETAAIQVERKGSRDAVRFYAEQIKINAMKGLEELALLRAKAKKLEYRYGEQYLIGVLQQTELLRIEMRKRKLSKTATPKVGGAKPTNGLEGIPAD